MGVMCLNLLVLVNTLAAAFWISRSVFNTRFVIPLTLTRNTVHICGQQMLGVQEQHCVLLN